ncbi:MAG: hypothetical protein MJ250_02535 [Alphaproteobacteria bacterium]|nr:hypothetical protein [Alphaproteobacteria bacterium]
MKKMSMNINIDQAKYFDDILIIILANALKYKLRNDDITHDITVNFKNVLKALFNIECVDNLEMNGKQYNLENIDEFEKALKEKGIEDCFSINQNPKETLNMFKKITSMKL